VTRFGRLVKGAGALALLVVLGAGIPWALWHFIGWPLPHHLPSSGQLGRALDQRGIADQTLIDALAVVVWATWAVIVASIIVEIPAALAGRHAPRLPVAGIFQPLTGRLVAAVLVAFLMLAARPSHAATPGSLGGSLSAASGRQAVASMVVREPTPGGAVLTDVIRSLPANSAQSAPPAGATDAVTPAETASASRTYVVERGDTLWAIAEQQLGDPLRWSEIYQLNEGRPQPDGTTLTDPHWIDPGWVLLLPAVPTVPPAPVPTPPSATAPTSPTTPPTAPITRPSTTAVSPSSPSTVPWSTTSTPPGRAAAPSKGEQQRTVAAAAPIRLPSGSIVAGSFAAGVLSALAAGRLRRRRHYRAQPPRPGRHVKAEPRSAGLHDLLVAVRAKRDGEDEDLTAEVQTESIPMTAVPDDEALARPDMIEVAIRGEEVVRLGISEWPGLALMGPGAASCLRAWLAALITRNGPYGVEILLVGPLGDRLFPGLALPGLRCVETADGALSRLEALIVARTRQLNDADVADVTAHRATSPEYPLPLVLIVTDMVPESLQPRWQSMAASATRLGFGALVLIPVHASDESADFSAQIVSGRIVIGEGGSIERVAPPALAEIIEGGMTFGLSATEVVALLGPVASVHNDHEFDEPDPVDEPSDNGLPGGGAHGVVRAEGHEGGNPSYDEPTDAGVVRWPATEDPVPVPAPIRIELLGPALVEAWGEKVSSGLRASAYELLAWYAMHPDGATAEAAIDALWPDAPGKRGRERFWTALGNLRSRLHGPGEDGFEILAKVGEHYRPDPSVLDLDLWRFEAALTDAARANERVAVVAALERAAAAYGGDFYPSADALWVEPAREDLHRRALDVHIRLAEYHGDDGRPDAAIAALERAIELDPICEDAYRRLIALQSQLGRNDAAQRAWRLLLGRLAELDLEPEATTAELIHDLLAPRSAPTGDRNRPRSRPA
jgi:DNA-binding SARP family transcriptional activator